MPFRDANHAIGERGLSWEFNWNALKNVFPPSDMNREMSDWPIHAWRYFHPISLCHPPKLRHASAIHRPASHRDRPRPRQMKSREECMALSRRSWSIRNNAVPICTDPRKCQVQFRVQTGMRLESDVHVIASNRV